MMAILEKVELEVRYWYYNRLKQKKNITCLQNNKY